MTQGSGVSHVPISSIYRLCSPDGAGTFALTLLTHFISMAAPAAAVTASRPGWQDSGTQFHDGSRTASLVLAVFWATLICTWLRYRPPLLRAWMEEPRRLHFLSQLTDPMGSTCTLFSKPLYHTQSSNLYAFIL